MLLLNSYGQCLLCATGVTFHLLARPAGDLNTFGGSEMQCVQQLMRRCIDYRNMNHLFAGIQQDSLITQTQGGELWNIHCRSLVGVIKAEDIFAGLLQCAVTLNIAVARPAGDAVCVIPTWRHDDA